MEQSVEIMAGVSFLILGLSLLLNVHDWVDWFESVRIGGRRVSLILGMMHLFFGSLLVALHWVWSGWEMLLTVIGVWAMAEGTLYLLFPGCLAKIIGWLMPYSRPVILASALATLLLGGALVYPHCIERCSL